VWCRAEITHRPAPPPPARVNAALHPAAPDMTRTAMLLVAWLSHGARWLLGAIDRQNLMRTQNDLKVPSHGSTFLHPRGLCPAPWVHPVRSYSGLARLCSVVAYLA
jgi:hypothetical protein